MELELEILFAGSILPLFRTVPDGAPADARIQDTIRRKRIVTVSNPPVAAGMLIAYASAFAEADIVILPAHVRQLHDIDPAWRLIWFFIQSCHCWVLLRSGDGNTLTFRRSLTACGIRQCTTSTTLKTSVGPGTDTGLCWHLCVDYRMPRVNFRRAGDNPPDCCQRCRASSAG